MSLAAAPGGANRPAGVRLQGTPEL